jgi:hypothetical protein
VILIKKNNKINIFLNKKIYKKGVEMSMSTIITLIICIALIIFVFIFSGAIRTYILSILERFTLRGR